MSKFNSTSTGVNTKYTSTTTKGSNSYFVSSTPKPTFNYDVEVTKLLKDLNFRRGLEVYTSTLYDKYEEISSTYSPIDSKYLNSLSDKIWKPTNLNDLELTISEINALKPIIEIIPRGVTKRVKEWIHLRRMISTMSYSGGGRRNIKFKVIDEVSGKLLGLIELSSDFCSLGVRDSHIGWSSENRFTDKMLGHIAVGSTIVPVQPFGFNFLGGKLMSMLLTSKVVRDEWERRYEQKLVGITTTSLYGNDGKPTQYDGMKQWKNIGETTGQTFIKPNQEIYKVWKNWLKVNFSEEYNKASTSSAPKQKVIQLLFSKLRLNPQNFHHGYRRGVYFSKFYQNSFEFLKGNTNEVGKELFDSSIEALVDEWKNDFAIPRYKSLVNRNKISSKTLFYFDILNLTWEQTLFNYLGIKTETLAPLKTKSVKGFISDTVFNVFLSKSYNINDKQTIVEVKTKVKVIVPIYFSGINSHLLETLYFSSFYRTIIGLSKSITLI
jgi:hypothetical protein